MRYKYNYKIYNYIFILVLLLYCYLLYSGLIGLLILLKKFKNLRPLILKLGLIRLMTEIIEELITAIIVLNAYFRLLVAGKRRIGWGFLFFRISILKGLRFWEFVWIVFLKDEIILVFLMQIFFRDFWGFIRWFILKWLLLWIDILNGDIWRIQIFHYICGLLHL